MRDNPQSGFLKQHRKQYRGLDEGGCPWWNEERQFNRWEAWQDMIQMAAWRPHTYMAGGTLVRLDRGETPPCSIRFLARRWNRSEKWVRSFLKNADELDRFRAQQNTPQGHTYIIVNYGTYQGQGHSDIAQEGTPRAQANGGSGRFLPEKGHSKGRSKGHRQGQGQSAQNTIPYETRGHSEGHDEGAARDTTRAQRGHSEEHKTEEGEEGEEEGRREEGGTPPASTGAPLADAPGSPACPHEEIVNLYHEMLPELRGVKVWNKQRRGWLRARWREDSERQNLDWWRDFFRQVRRSDFLMGRVESRNGRSPFEADLEWLVKPTNFAKVIEGKYEDRKDALGGLHPDFAHFGR